MLQQHVEQAAQIARSYLQQIEGQGVSLPGKCVLELGPGSDFGPALVMASCGAQVSVADLFLSRRSEEHHAAFNRAFLEAWDGPKGAIEQAVAAGYGGVIDLLDAPAERLPKENEAFDVVISNAVLEHVFDLPRTFRELYRVTKSGGVNLHQVDFRDHRWDFERPLEYLLAEEERFERSDVWQNKFGSRWRPIELEQFAKGAGFEVASVWPTQTASAEYMAGFAPRLRESNSRYRDWRDEDLNVLGALFVLKRP